MPRLPPLPALPHQGRQDENTCACARKVRGWLQVREAARRGDASEAPRGEATIAEGGRGRSFTGAAGGYLA